MNIQQAKEQVRRACIAYLTKDEFGDYIVPTETQRPVFLLGAPGVGKTAIVAQVARELNIGLVDYSMTHHTRQSAIGLPIIEKREFGGKECSVSEYTMSEIIASVYKDIEDNGNTEGILFLDEINCVSETLTPAMLRFLQSKIFGGHKVPAGWVVVCAGNPPEYNRSAHTFDIATLDRLKRVEIEPDYKAWRTWAQTQGTHPCVMSFLDLRPDCFYRVETKGKTQNFVTARAWSDLSTMMRLYDHHSLEIDESLVTHYIQLPSIAKEFSTYYALFSNYEEKYRIKDVLAGNASPEIVETAKQANFDERASLVSLLVDSMAANAQHASLEQQALHMVRPVLEQALAQNAQKQVEPETHENDDKAAFPSQGANTEAMAAFPAQDTKETKAAVLAQESNAEAMAAFLAQECENIAQDLSKNALRYREDHNARYVRNRAKTILEDISAKLHFSTQTASQNSHEAQNACKTPDECIIDAFDALLCAQEENAGVAARAIDAGISFVAQAYGEENELVLCLSAVTANPILSDVIAEYGCSAYFAHQDLISMDARRMKLKKRLEELA